MNIVIAAHIFLAIVFPVTVLADLYLERRYSEKFLRKGEVITLILLFIAYWSLVLMSYFANR